VRQASHRPDVPDRHPTVLGGAGGHRQAGGHRVAVQLVWDEGVISGWEGSYCDLRQPRPQDRQKTKGEVPISDVAVASLRGLEFVGHPLRAAGVRGQADPAGEGAVLDADEEDLDELLGFVAAEANHETNRRRQKRLDEAFAALSDALAVMDG
jgi:hypothetical protein